MRITNGTITRNYLAGLNQNLGLLNKYSTQVQTGQRFNRMSEDPASGVRALQIRRNLTKLDTYKSNVQSARSLYDAAETALREQVTELTKSVTERWTQAINGTNDEGAHEAIAQELEALQKQLVTLGNTKFSDRYLYGGTNTGHAPFTVDDDGELCYNGKRVSDLTQAEVNAMNTSYIDIGLGVSLNGQLVDSNTAFPVTFNGAKIFGYGDNNLYNILGDMICMLRDGEANAVNGGELLTKFQDASSSVMLQVTEIGAQTKYLDSTLERLDTEKLNLVTRQQSVEGKDPADAILDWTLQEYVYNAALYMGQRLLQPTLFNFMN